MAPPKDANEWDFPHFREVEQMENLGLHPDRGREKDRNTSVCQLWQEFWSVKFYPYNEPGVDPVFAVVGADRILICRPPPPGQVRIQFIRVLLDDEPDACNFTCAWTKNLETGTPLLCASGENSKIKVFDVLTGECIKVLAGHGGGINDLAVSPVNPYILASASDDSTIRIWSLDPAHSSQPCAAILAGEGHKDNVLSLSFHSNGRYLLSSGSDHLINLWTLPSFPDSNTGTKRPTIIYYPHFSTSEVHAAVVDCVCFWNDVILSKTESEGNIVLWSITGFDSSLPPPSPEDAPTTQDPQKDTRSSFFKPSSPTNPTSTTIIPNSKLYTRHLQLGIPESASSPSIIFMRFALFSGTPTHPHPVLAYCNTKSKIYFFDFARLVEYHDVIDTFPTGERTISLPTNSDDGSTTPEAGGGFAAAKNERALNPRKHPFLQPYQTRNRGGHHNSSQGRSHSHSQTLPLHHLHQRSLNNSSNRASSPTESTSSHHTNTTTTSNSNQNPSQSQNASAEPSQHRSVTVPIGKVDWGKSLPLWKRKYYMGDPLENLEPHGSEVVKQLEFCGRQVAWSPGGEWLAFVGSGGVMGVLGRWQKDK